MRHIEAEGKLQTTLYFKQESEDMQTKEHHQDNIIPRPVKSMS